MSHQKLEIGATRLPIGHSMRLSDEKTTSTEEKSLQTETPKRSKLLDRLGSFLEEFKTSNLELAERIEHEGTHNVNIELCDEEQQHIEMDIAIGELDNNVSSPLIDESSLESSSSSHDTEDNDTLRMKENQANNNSSSSDSQKDQEYQTKNNDNRSSSSNTQWNLEHQTNNNDSSSRIRREETVSSNRDSFERNECSISTCTTTSHTHDNSTSYDPNVSSTCTSSAHVSTTCSCGGPDTSIVTTSTSVSLPCQSHTSDLCNASNTCKTVSLSSTKTNSQTTDNIKTRMSHDATSQISTEAQSTSQDSLNVEHKQRIKEFFDACQASQEHSKSLILPQQSNITTSTTTQAKRSRLIEELDDNAV